MQTGGKRILVVDDLHDSALSLTLVLQRLGHTAQFVTDPWQAIEAVRRLRPELVFLDIGMPEINGYAAAPDSTRMSPSRPIRKPSTAS